MLEKSVHACDLSDLLEFISIIKSVSQATRTISNSSTCIHNIFLSSYMAHGIVDVNVFTTSFSDHFIQVVACNINNTTSRDDTIYRKYSETGKIDFCSTLENESWNTLYQVRDVDNKYKYFVTIFLSHFNKSFPKHNT